jgi:hypothetical protein
MLSFFLGSILWCHESGDHPKEGLAQIWATIQIKKETQKSNRRLMAKTITGETKVNF